MASDRILELLAKQLGQNASESELAELNELLSTHPEHQYFSQILASIEGEKRHYEPSSAEKDVVQEGWSLLENVFPLGQTKKRSGKYFYKRIFISRGVRLVALWAGFILLAGGFYYMVVSPSARQEKDIALKTKRLTVPYGAPVRKILPDSSIVWLNAGSHLRFVDNVVKKKREVYLEGEAYFDVRKEASRPFVVHAGNVIIRVLGTEFNIKAYNDENRIETTLINGKIQVRIADNPDKLIILSPKEKLTVINQKFNLRGIDNKKQKELSFQVKEVAPLQVNAPIPEIAWLQDKLSFHNERFDVLAVDLSRRYNVHFIFVDTLLKKERLNGLFENESIQKVLKILKMTTPFDYSIKRDSVFIYKSVAKT